MANQTGKVCWFGRHLKQLLHEALGLWQAVEDQELTEAEYARRGAELGIATPVNQTLHALVKLLEEAAAKAAASL